MSDFNTLHNRAAWVDIPVVDMDRAAAFYRAVLAVEVHKENFDGGCFCLLEHQDGNGGCLLENEREIASDKGVFVYMNVDERIRNVILQVAKHGGQVVQEIRFNRASQVPYDCAR